MQRDPGGHPRSCLGAAERPAAPLDAVLAHDRAVCSTGELPHPGTATHVGAEIELKHGVAYSSPCMAM